MGVREALRQQVTNCQKAAHAVQDMCLWYSAAAAESKLGMQAPAAVKHAVRHYAIQ
jgi:hypothetical protein